MKLWKKRKLFQQILMGKATSETESFYLLLVSLSVTIVLLTAASFYRCLIKYKLKQKHLTYIAPSRYK